MAGTPSIGTWLLTIGLGVVVLGGIVWGLERLGIRLGHLPLDFHFKGARGEVHIPLGTSILLSIVLTLLGNWLLRR